MQAPLVHSTSSDPLLLMSMESWWIIPLLGIEMLDSLSLISPLVSDLQTELSYGSARAMHE